MVEQLRPAINSIIEETVHGLVDADCTLRRNTYCRISGHITIDITLSGVGVEGILFSNTNEIVDNKITIKGIAIDLVPGCAMYKPNCWTGQNGEKKN